MNLTEALEADLVGLAQEIDSMREIAKAMGHLVPALALRATDLLQHGHAAMARVRGIRTTIAAQRMCGEMEAKAQPPVIAEMPLFAPRVPLGIVEGFNDDEAKARQQRDAFFRSLHAAGDHTLDAETSE